MRLPMPSIPSMAAIPMVHPAPRTSPSAHRAHTPNAACRRVLDPPRGRRAEAPGTRASTIARGCGLKTGRSAPAAHGRAQAADRGRRAAPAALARGWATPVSSRPSGRYPLAPVPTRRAARVRVSDLTGSTVPRPTPATAGRGRGSQLAGRAAAFPGTGPLPRDRDRPTLPARRLTGPSSTAPVSTVRVSTVPGSTAPDSTAPDSTALKIAGLAAVAPASAARGSTSLGSTVRGSTVPARAARSGGRVLSSTGPGWPTTGRDHRCPARADRTSANTMPGWQGRVRGALERVTMVREPVSMIQE
jgi:hypothetical protein